MVALIIISCLSAAPHSCEPVFAAHFATMETCLAEAYPRAILYSRAHPDVTIKRMRCRLQGVET